MSLTPPRSQAVELKVNDPVHVKNRDARSLEGVVAYLGPVSFSTDTDWVGIRLTGSSVGLGKNDGSVQGKVYFECEPNGGLFVRQAAVSKRTLTKLEELRLKRALAAGGTTASAAATSTPRSTRVAAASPRGAGDAEATSASSTLRRIEEIKQRRAAMERSKQQAAAKEADDDNTDDTPRSPSPLLTPRAATTSEYEQQVDSKEREQLKAQVEQLTQSLRLQKEETDKLQTQLKTQQEAAAAAAASKASVPETPLPEKTEKKDDDEWERLQSQVSHLTLERDQLEDKHAQIELQYKHLQNELLQEKKQHSTHLDELTHAKAESVAFQKELANLTDQAAHRTASDASHYKERAKLQAEIGALKRKVEQVEDENKELENSLEELTLDKEQLLQDKETLEDRLEELKLDAETAQMEVEELRMELEDAQQQEARPVDASTTDAEDMVQALSIQNARLREALIRLREQSSVEKMDLARQTRAAEKDAESGRAMMAEVESLRSTKMELEEQVRDLKDMVEQGAAYEEMVETLSDRVLSLEEDIMTLQATIRDMEEAADITAEMEEVQAEELKALSRDLEGRDTIILNLEEAIKMQRRREEDFQRTVGNYRASVEKLKQEKKALLELHEGGEGEKSNLIAASQKALARAALLVSDAVKMRKREAQAVLTRINYTVQRHMSQRLERLLPHNAVATEISAIKGELRLCTVVGKASKSLEGIAESFTKTLSGAARDILPNETESKLDASTHLKLPEEVTQGVVTVVHQTEFAFVAIDVGSELLRILSAGQWPEFVNPETSADLGSIAGHTVADLDIALGGGLKLLKEEGVLSPHQSNINALRQIVQTTKSNLIAAIENEGVALGPDKWSPPGWQIFRDVSYAKFACLGAGAAIALCINSREFSPAGAEPGVASPEVKAALRPLCKRLDQMGTEAGNICLRMAQFDIRDERALVVFSTLAAGWNDAACHMVDTVKGMLLSNEGLNQTSLATCEKDVDSVSQAMAQVSSALRTVKLNSVEAGFYHPLSPEAEDPWAGVAGLARSIRSIDADAEDVNHLVRGRTVEHHLADAIENEPKLSIANAKVSSLEKSLSLRSKEIAMQNARLSELERLLAKTSSQPSARSTPSEKSSAQELGALKEENRVLMEAMDVMQRQVDEYESELRFLKDTRSPNPSRRAQRTPKRSTTSIMEYSTDRRSGLDELQPTISPAMAGALEAALFMPALQAARRDAAKWKTKATITSLLELPPLSVPSIPSGASGDQESKSSYEDGDDCYTQLTSALSNYRIEKASIRVVDLSSTTKRPRAHLEETVARNEAAAERLHVAAASARQWIVDNGGRAH